MADIERIYLLVHPFNDLINAIQRRGKAVKDYPRPLHYWPPPKNLEKYWRDFKLNKDEKYFLDLWARKWEKFLRKVARNPKSQVIIVAPIGIEVLPQVSKRLEWIQQMVSEIQGAHGNKPLVIYDGFNFLTPANKSPEYERMLQIVQKIKPKRKITITSFGEYYNVCVEGEAENLSDFLSLKRIEANVEQIKHLSLDEGEDVWSEEMLFERAAKKIEDAYGKAEADRKKQKARKKEIDAAKQRRRI